MNIVNKQFLYSYSSCKGLLRAYCNLTCIPVTVSAQSIKTRRRRRPQPPQPPPASQPLVRLTPLAESVLYDQTHDERALRMMGINPDDPPVRVAALFPPFSFPQHRDERPFMTCLQSKGGQSYAWHRFLTRKRETFVAHLAQGPPDFLRAPPGSGIAADLAPCTEYLGKHH